MHVGTCRVRLHLPENHDLKGKRHIVRPLVERVRKTFNAAVAEVDDLDIWQSSVLGIAVVGNDARHVNEVLSHIVEFVEQSAHDAIVVDYEIELITL